MTVAVQQNILRFEVSVHYAVLVHGVESHGDLSSIESCHVVRELFHPAQVEEQLTSSRVVQNKVPVRGG